MMIHSYSLIFFFIVIFLSGCNKSSSEPDKEPRPTTNTPRPTTNAPIAPSVAAETNEDTAKTITLNGTDVDGNTLSYLKVSNPTHGSININGNTATYTPTANYNGNDSFTYKINDGTNDSNTATVSITVLAVNDAPTANAGENQTGLEGKSFNLSGSGTDIEDDTLTYRWEQTDNSGVTAQLANTQSATASLRAPEVNTDTTLRFTLSIEDGNGGITTDTVNVLVQNLTINDSELRRCFGNRFPSGIALYQLTTIECNDVNLSNTDLSELEKLPNLINLSLSENLLGNNITTLSGLNKLIVLALVGNNISDINSLSAMTNLTSLTLNNNNISDISVLSEMNKLTSLTLNYNNISDISVLPNLTTLAELNLSNNRVNDLEPLLRLSKLTSLSLSNNRVRQTTLSDISLFKNLTTLTHLNLSDNSISDLNALLGLTKLITLNLANNKITEVKLETEDDVFVESFFSSMSALTTLNLKKNKLISIYSISFMPNKLSLDITSNCISSFSDFEQVANITIIGKTSQQEYSECRFVISKSEKNKR